MPNFNLLNHAADICVLVFNGIFNGHNVARIAAVDLIDQRGHSSRFAGACGATDQYESAGQAGKLFHRRRQVKVLEKWHGGGQRADSSGSASTLLMEIDTEASEIGVAIRRV